MIGPTIAAIAATVVAEATRSIYPLTVYDPRHVVRITEGGVPPLSEVSERPGPPEGFVEPKIGRCSVVVDTRKGWLARLFGG